MAEMRSALGAYVFYASDEPLAVLTILDTLSIERTRKARPTGSAVVLCFARKQWLVTDNTVIGAVFGVCVVLVGVGPFGAGFLSHAVLLWGQAFTQLFFGEGDLCHV